MAICVGEAFSERQGRNLLRPARLFASHQLPYEEALRPGKGVRHFKDGIGRRAGDKARANCGSNPPVGRAGP